MTDVAPTPTPRPVVVWDVVLTIFFLLTGVGLAVLLAIFGALLAFASDSCTDLTCNYGQISAGILVAVIAPIVLTLAALILSIVLLAKRRRAFWVPLAGSILSVLGWGAGFLLVTLAVDGYYGG